MNATKRFLVLVAPALVAIVLVGCSTFPSLTGGSRGRRVLDFDRLLATLRDAGATVEVVEKEFSQPFFLGSGCRITVDGHEVQVFDYEDESAAEAEAAQIAPGGGSVGTTMISWIATPHFYQSGTLIALYVGDDAGVLAALENALGPQIAGG